MELLFPNRAPPARLQGPGQLGIDAGGSASGTLTWPQAGAGQSKQGKRLSLTSGICPGPSPITARLQQHPPWLLFPPAQSLAPHCLRCPLALQMHRGRSLVSLSLPSCGSAQSSYCYQLQTGVWQHPVTSFPSTRLGGPAQLCLGDCCLVRDGLTLCFAALETFCAEQGKQA